MLIIRSDTIEKISLPKQEIMAFRGERLKAMRDARGYSQQELADLLEVIQPTIVKWEKSRSEPNAVYLKRMAEILGITVDYLLGLTDSPMERLSGIDPQVQRILDLMNNPHVSSQIKERIAYLIEGALLALPKSGDRSDK